MQSSAVCARSHPSPTEPKGVRPLTSVRAGRGLLQGYWCQRLERGFMSCVASLFLCSETRSVLVLVGLAGPESDSLQTRSAAGAGSNTPESELEAGVPLDPARAVGESKTVFQKPWNCWLQLILLHKLPVALGMQKGILEPFPGPRTNWQGPGILLSGPKKSLSVQCYVCLTHQ